MSDDIDNGADAGSAEVAPKSETPAYEPTPFDGLAKEMGWFPPDEYSGDADKFRSAEDYIKYAAQNTKALKRDLKAVKDTADRLARTSATITERALEKQRVEIEARHKQAVEDGDYAAVRAAERDLRNVDEQARDTSPESTFAASNAWYGKDDEATAYAVSVSQRLANQGRSVEDQLAEAEKSVRKRFPELFDEEPAPRKAAPGVNAPLSRASSTRPREKTFADLPREAQAAYENQAQMMKVKFNENFTKEEYTKLFLSQ